MPTKKGIDMVISNKTPTAPPRSSKWLIQEMSWIVSNQLLAKYGNPLRIPDFLLLTFLMILKLTKFYTKFSIWYTWHPEKEWKRPMDRWPHHLGTSERRLLLAERLGAEGDGQRHDLWPPILRGQGRCAQRGLRRGGCVKKDALHGVFFFYGIVWYFMEFYGISWDFMG